MALITSYNGWTASQNPADFGGLDNRDVPGAPGIKLAPGVRAGDAATVLFYVAAQLHKRVEPGVMPGCWGYSYRASKNSAALLSTHSSATGFDWNAPRHPNGKSGTFTKAQVAEIGKIIREVDGVVYWGGGGWGAGTWDEMHFELSDPPAKVAKVAARLRAGTATPTPSTQEDDDMKLFCFRSDPAQWDSTQRVGTGAVALAAPGFWWLVPDMSLLAIYQKRAICGPLQNLPPNEFDHFRDVFLSAEVNDEQIRSIVQGIAAKP